MLTLLRLGYGSALLLRPASVLDAAHLPADKPSLIFARVLGARHLVEGVLLLRSGRRMHLIGAAVDAAHALTSVVWAVPARGHRRALVLNAVAAAGFAATGAAAA